MYVGAYRDGTGWAQAATDYILALDAAGVDVVPRAVKLNDAKLPIPERVRELEAKSARGCDVVVQHVLPHMMDYNGRLFNVGLYASETSDFRSTTWADRLNAMDKAVVVNRQMVVAARRSGVKIPLEVVPHATDVSRFQRSYEPLDALRPYKDAGEFLFYTVGEFNRRKNLLSLLKAFHLEFDPSEPVRLVIKTASPGMSPEQSRSRVEHLCEEVKRGLKLHGGDTDRYAREVVITERLTPEGVMRLHATCDCFVQPSFGEAWSIPAFDAMGMGRTPIVTAATGYLDYVSDDTGWLVGCHEEPVFGVTDTFSDLFVGSETWSSVDIGDLRRCMRVAYANAALREEKAGNGITRAYDFAYEAVGPMLRKAIQSHERHLLEDRT